MFEELEIQTFIMACDAMELTIQKALVKRILHQERGATAKQLFFPGPKCLYHCT